MSEHSVAITGRGVVSPIGSNVAHYWSSFQAGRSRLKPTHLTPWRRAPALAGVVESQTTGQWRYADFALRAAAQAISEARADDLMLRTGLVASSAIGATLEIEHQFAAEGLVDPSALGFDHIAQVVSEAFGLGSPIFALSTGCTAGLDALGLAFDLISQGHAERMLVVTSDATQSPVVFAAFDKIGALSRRIEYPERASSPLDCVRDGFVLGEGSAAVFLEDADLARERGARCIALIRGWSSVSSAFHMTSMRTSGEDLKRVIDQALCRSAMSADDVDLIDIHGTSTRINDLAEGEVIRTCFGSRKSPVIVSAQKGLGGHQLGASNLIELVGLTCMLQHQYVPGVCGLVDLSSDLKHLAPSLGPRHACIRYALKLSSGFSGIHTAVALEATR